jgi:TDG/mug DNA glycosylase family protein
MRDEVARRTVGKVPDVIAPGLRVLFCGINPGLYSGAVGHHFARPGNRFWPVLHLAGFTRRLLSPYQERELLGYGLGITNLVGRTTAKASDLSARELVEGGKRLQQKIERWRPGSVAILGIDAYRKAFSRPRPAPGRQNDKLGGACLWVLPNPSGLNAHYPRVEDLVEVFRPLARAARSLPVTWTQHAG